MASLVHISNTLNFSVVERGNYRAPEAPIRNMHEPLVLQVLRRILAEGQISLKAPVFQTVDLGNSLQNLFSIHPVSTDNPCVLSLGLIDGIMCAGMEPGQVDRGPDVQEQILLRHGGQSNGSPSSLSAVRSRESGKPCGYESRKPFINAGAAAGRDSSLIDHGPRRVLVRDRGGRR